MKMYGVVLLVIILNSLQALSSSFADTVLSKSGFQSLSDYSKVIALNNEAKNNLDRLNVQVLDYLKYAEQIALKLNNSDLKFKTYLNYGYLYKLKKEYEPSVAYYYKALPLVDNDTKKKIEVLIGLGETYRASNAYYIGIKVLNQALSVIADGESESFKSEKASIYNRIASIYYELIFTPFEKDKKKTINKVIKYIDSSLQNTRSDDFYMLISNYNVKGSAYSHLQDLKRSEENMNKALQIMRQFPDSAFTYYHYHNVMLNYAGMYYHCGKYKEAEALALEALRYLNEKKMKVNEDLLYIVLAEVYAKMGDYKNAYKYKQLGYDYYVRDRYITQQKTLLDLDAKYNYQRQEAEIKQQQELLIYQTIGIFIAIVLIIIIIIANKSRLKALRKINEMTNSQNNELKELNATKDKFFSIIAHDLKNPVFSIHSLVNYLVMDFDELPQHELKHNLEVLERNTKNLAQLLDNLLTWARAQNGKIPHSPMELSINAIIKNSIEIAEIQATEKSIAMSYKVTLNDGVLVHADSNSLITVFRNILSNAIKFTTNNGKVNISAIEDDVFVTISITDTGVGIPKDKLPTIFATDRNYQSNGTNQELGTGLGLILCREFIEKNGGKIWAESEKGVGSAFYFTIPKAII